MDYIQSGLQKIGAQYRHSKKFRAYISALLKFSQEMEALFHKMSSQTDIDKACGYQLDTIGSILGLDRRVSHAVSLIYFGFSDTPGATGFGEEIDESSAGGDFYNEGSPLHGTIRLPDETYRSFLRARIVRNSTTGTNEDLIRVMQCLFPKRTPKVVVQDSGCMAVCVSVARILSANEVALLRGVEFLPRLAGVRLTLGVHFKPGSTFGFDDTVHSRGFGEENIKEIGSPFAEQI